MKHLYVIGNGFDLFSGLKTSYRDFSEWLKKHYAFVYEAFESAYDIQNIEWWNDFEVSLGKLDIKRYVIQNTPPPKSFDEICKEIQEKRANEEKLSTLPPSLHKESPSADRLEGLFDIVHYCLRKWILSMTSVNNPKYIQLEKQNSVFLNFNYTKTLEGFYNISKDQILYIHGSAYDSDKLIFGHNSFADGEAYRYDGEKVAFVLERYHKNPYEFIYKNIEFFEKIKDVETIHILGLSFSPVDIDYLDWIYKHTTSGVKWEVSWYSEEDSKRIDEFIQSHRNLVRNLEKIQLAPIKAKYV